ncbi:gamma-glutamyl-gamma-aminobutyrate hydrolase family protein [Actinocorallia longicatena]|uniref:Gamma-glutamyl-gamma-aminobutyrate hydrolase family protein n=1 Tax=Actinocorallia longicatena TaxID=111803 RepID=A0ABP6PXN0_9ACTN
MPQPLIGVTTYQEPARWSVWVREAALLATSYVRSVERSGGIPVLLPPLDDLSSVETVVGRLDGIIIAGGPDVEPSRYGAQPHERTGTPSVVRDRWELAVLRAAIDQDKPFLGVCRGMQLLNVCRGGTLIQHLPDSVGHEGHAPVLGKFSRHKVQVGLASSVGKVLGEYVDVPTYHHQAVDRLGKGLVPVAWAKDQVVEAVELQGHRFGIGVQWHPEEGDDLRIFQALVEAASAPSPGQ